MRLPSAFALCACQLLLCSATECQGEGCALEKDISTLLQSTIKVANPARRGAAPGQTADDIFLQGDDPDEETEGESEGEESEGEEGEGAGSGNANFQVGDKIAICEDGKCEETAYVIEVLGGSKYAVDYKDGHTAYEEIELGAHNAKIVEKAAQKCNSSAPYFLEASGACLQTCPPGYLDYAATGSCKPCYGKINERRRGSTKCYPCAPGHISKGDADECQNMQDTCDTSQCGPCRTCMCNLAPSINSCAANSGATNANGKKCYDPGRHWCSGAQEGLKRCQSESLGCWYRLMCNRECICDTWKQIFCGGKTRNDPCPADISAVPECSASQLVEESVTSRNTSSPPSGAASLEESLSGKRDC